MEIINKIYQLKIPIPGNPLGTINVFLIITNRECMLIDTGWNTDEVFESLKGQMNELGMSLSDLKYIAIIHVHPDHYGLVGRIAKYTNAQLILHEMERPLLSSRHLQYTSLLEEMHHWLTINGVPAEDSSSLQLASMENLGLVAVAMPDQIVHGGEHIKLGEFDLALVTHQGIFPSMNTTKISCFQGIIF